MRKRQLATWIACFLIAAPAMAQNGSGELVQRINGLRNSLNLPAYSQNSALAAAAQQHAQYMVNSGTVSHVQVNGSTPRSRAIASGYPTDWVAENIYGGTNASIDAAWTFWINSPVHYRGLTSTNFNEIGVGIASGEWGTAYVLVFGTQVQSWTPPQTRGGGTDVEEAAAPPMFVVGVDEAGNIMHEVQAGDTLGDIALLYGYTWDDLPYMLEINALNEENVRSLEVGSVFLVPPQAGTYTPTPGAPTETPAPPSQTPVPPTIPPASPTITQTPDLPSQPGSDPVTQMPTATMSVSVIEASATPAVIALVPSAPPDAALTENRSVVMIQERRSPWLYAAIVVQIIVVLGAGVEFVRRLRG